MTTPYDANTYKVEPLKVHDGDTFTAKVDPGFDIEITLTFRLEGLNAPEITGTEKRAGLASKAYFENKINGAKEVLVKTKKKEKYGRYLATVFCDGVNVNESMIRDGFAVPMKY